MSVAPITPAAGGLPPSVGSQSSPGGVAGFDKVFATLIQGANQHQLQSDAAVRQLASGKTDSIHNVVLSAAKADLSFRLILEIRNKLIDSYQEIMRMQV